GLVLNAAALDTPHPVGLSSSNALVRCQPAPHPARVNGVGAVSALRYSTSSAMLALSARSIGSMVVTSQRYVAIGSIASNTPIDRRWRGLWYTISASTSSFLLDITTSNSCA